MGDYPFIAEPYIAATGLYGLEVAELDLLVGYLRHELDETREDGRPVLDPDTDYIVASNLLVARRLREVASLITKTAHDDGPVSPGNGSGVGSSSSRGCSRAATATAAGGSSSPRSRR